MLEAEVPCTDIPLTNPLKTLSQRFSCESSSTLGADFRSSLALVQSSFQLSPGEHSTVDMDDAATTITTSVPISTRDDPTMTIELMGISVPPTSPPLITQSSSPLLVTSDVNDSVNMIPPSDTDNSQVSSTSPIASVPCYLSPGHTLTLSPLNGLCNVTSQYCGDLTTPVTSRTNTRNSLSKTYASTINSISGIKGVGCVKKRGKLIVCNAARERSRVKTLRTAFLDLQRSLPSVPPDTKLSKLDVLVLATTYISQLMKTLEDDARKTQATLAGNQDTSSDVKPETTSARITAKGYLHPVKVSGDLPANTKHLYNISTMYKMLNVPNMLIC